LNYSKDNHRVAEQRAADCRRISAQAQATCANWTIGEAELTSAVQTVATKLLQQAKSDAKAALDYQIALYTQGYTKKNDSVKIIPIKQYLSNCTQVLIDDVDSAKQLLDSISTNLTTQLDSIHSQLVKTMRDKARTVWHERIQNLSTYLKSELLSTADDTPLDAMLLREINHNLEQVSTQPLSKTLKDLVAGKIRTKDHSEPFVKRFIQNLHPFGAREAAERTAFGQRQNEADDGSNALDKLMSSSLTTPSEAEVLYAKGVNTIGFAEREPIPAVSTYLPLDEQTWPFLKPTDRAVSVPLANVKKNLTGFITEPWFELLEGDSRKTMRGIVQMSSRVAIKTVRDTVASKLQRLEERVQNAGKPLDSTDILSAMMAQSSSVAIAATATSLAQRAAASKYRKPTDRVVNPQT
jgi:hypothetical protein